MPTEAGQTPPASPAPPPLDVVPHGQKKGKHFPGLNKETNLIRVSSDFRRAGR